MSLDVEVGASLTIGDVEKVMDDHRKKRGGHPKFTIVKGSGSITGTGVVAQFPIVCNGTPMGPNIGFIWALDSITTFAQDDHTLYNPTPGTSFVGGIYVGGAAGDLTLSNLAFPGLTFPGVFDFADGQYVQHGESIVVSTSAALATGQQIGLNLWGRQYKVADLLDLSGRL